MQINDRVIMPDQDGITPMPDWPVQGSQYECEGVVVDTSVDFAGRTCLDILWENGNRLHTIREKYLEKVEDCEYRKQKKKLVL